MNTRANRGKKKNKVNQITNQQMNEQQANIQTDTGAYKQQRDCI